MSLRLLNPNAEVLNKSSALHMNINAAKGLQDVLKSNLGPKGTIKMYFHDFSFDFLFLTRSTFASIASLTGYLLSGLLVELEILSSLRTVIRS